MYVNKSKDGSKVIITTTVPYEMREECRKKGIPLNHIFQRGFMAFNGEPQLLPRTRELEEQVDKLTKANIRLQERIFAIQNDLLANVNHREV
jgi:hypothetical protein